MSKFPVDFQKSDDVWVSSAGKTISYTDGDETEQYLMGVLRDVQNLRSDSAALVPYIRDWASRYHLSSERANLLRGLAIQKDASILELGCGCGAITRYLGDNGNTVVAVEGSLRRAQIARARCRDLANVEVIASNFDSVTFEKKFDIVTLIGVLEYAPAFWTRPDDPFMGTLQIAIDHLKDDGVLVVAIENQHGIKYLSGCREDHLASFFSGIQNYPDAGVRTFGRNQLARMIYESGLPDLELMLPFPDYKVPSAVINAAFATADGAAEFNLIDWCRSQYQDYGSERVLLFNDHLALEGLAENGLLADCANSFLFLARRTSDGPTAISRVEWVAKRFNTGRRAECRTVTTLTGPVVAKDCMGGLLPPGSPIRHELVHEAPFLPYTKSLSFLMEKSLCRETEVRGEFCMLVKKWVDFVYRHVDPASGVLPDNFLDCIPDNLLLNPAGELHYIDREWVALGRLTPGYVIIRGLLGFWVANRDWIEKAFFQGEYTFLDYVNLSLSGCGITADRGLLERALRLEDEFQSAVAATPAIYSVYLDKVFEPKGRRGIGFLAGGAQIAKPMPVDVASREFEAVLQKNVAERLACLTSGNSMEPQRLKCTRSYDIIVPIYNATEHVRRCVLSLIRYTRSNNRILLLDDASTDIEMQPMLDGFASSYPNVQVISSDVNCGFIGNMNKGFALAERDVVILNSDTEVTPFWLERMERCLLSSPDIGIVSPLSNNATILSIPDMARDNEIPPCVTANDMAELVARYSDRLYPRIPTAVGFCMLVKKSVLDALGGFNPVFGAGYGEECDFCMRAWRSGIEVVCCDDAFVRHYGKASFGAGDEMNEKREKNAKLFNEMWPTYEKAVLAYCLDNPLRRLQEKVGAALSTLPDESRPHVLHVIHTFGSKGGTEGHTLDLAVGLRDSFRSTVMFPGVVDVWADADTKRHNDFFRCCSVNVRNCLSKQTINGHRMGIFNEDAERVFSDFLCGDSYDIVHFQHLLGWSSLMLPLYAKALGKKVVLSLHDYFYLCPEFNMVRRDLTRCGKAKCDPFDSDCLGCLGSRAGGIDKLQSYLFQRDALVRRIMAAADVLIAPSKFVFDRFIDAFGDLVADKMVVVPHGTAIAAPRPVSPGSGKLRAAFIGSFSERKGAGIFLAAAKSLKGHPVEMKVYGPASVSLAREMEQMGVVYCGEYAQSDLPAMLSEVDVVVTPSLVDETFCLTINEAISLGVPVVAASVGAIPERIIDGWNGYLFPCADSAELAEILRGLAYDPERLKALRSNIERISVLDTDGNISGYRSIYDALTNSDTSRRPAFQKYLQVGRSDASPSWRDFAFAPSFAVHDGRSAAAISHAMSLKKKGDFAGAVSAFKGLYQSGDASVIVDIGDCYACAGETEMAVRSYDTALDEGIRPASALTGKAAVSLMAGDVAGAIDFFSLALQEDPDHVKALKGIAAAYVASGDMGRALSSLHSVVMLDPDDIEAVAEAVRIAYYVNDFTVACDCLDRYLEDHPGDVDMLFTYAGILYKVGADEEASAKLETVFLLTPEYAGAAELATLIAARTGAV